MNEDAESVGDHALAAGVPAERRQSGLIRQTGRWAFFKLALAQHDQGAD
jgi:hypothetical protein